jgi:hypothetical protein
MPVKLGGDAAVDGVGHAGGRQREFEGGFLGGREERAGAELPERCQALVAGAEALGGEHGVRLAIAAAGVRAGQVADEALLLARTRPPFSMTARFRWVKAFAISGRRCIVSTLFGGKPRVDSKNRATWATSSEWSTGKGATSGMAAPGDWKTRATRIVRRPAPLGRGPAPDALSAVRFSAVRFDHRSRGLFTAASTPKAALLAA